jgi:predicted Zn-dependent protease
MLVSERTTRRPTLRFVVPLFLSLVVISTVVVAVPTARAYTVFSAKWASPSASYVQDGSFSQWLGFAPTFSGAASDWNSTGRFNFYSSVSSANHIKADEYIGTDLAGTRRTVTGSYITQFNLIVNTYSGFRWYIGSPPVPSGYYDLRTVLRHELGHALGLCHSHSTSTLMYTTVYQAQSKPVDNDAIYGADYLYHFNQYEPGPEGGCF